MSGPRRRGDSGMAALELAIVTTLLTALIAGVVPLALLFAKRVDLGRDAGDVARFATARADKPRSVTDPVSGVVYPISRDALPLRDAILAELRRVSGIPYAFDTDVVTAGCQPAADQCLALVPDQVDQACPGGSRFKVVLTTTVSTGPFGNLLGPSTKTLSAQADSCRE